jgi:hypothetical protein
LQGLRDTTEIAAKHGKQAEANMQAQANSTDNAQRIATAQLDELLQPVAPLRERPQSGQFSIKIADESSFTTKKICAFRHNFNEHSLMQIDRLGKLAESLATSGQCRFITPGITEATPFDHKGQSPDGRSVSEVFRTIEEPGSWVALYNIQTDPAYRGFLQEVMASVDHIVSREEKVFDIRGFIFISAPPSVTPFHIDRENNFWLNIHGRKTMSVWDHTNHSVVSAANVEDFIVYRSLEKVRLNDEIRAQRIDFDCGPGDGVYFPATTPHMTKSDTAWAKPGDGVAVSIGIDFYTDVTRRNAYIYTANRSLRRLGMSPRDPGASKLADAMKHSIGQLSVALRKRFRGYTPPPGF